MKSFNCTQKQQKKRTSKKLQTRPFLKQGSLSQLKEIGGTKIPEEKNRPRKNDIHGYTCGSNLPTKCYFSLTRFVKCLTPHVGKNRYFHTSLKTI